MVEQINTQITSRKQKLAPQIKELRTLRTKFQELENHNIFLAQLKARSIKLVNIGAEDLEGSTLDAGRQRTLVARTRTPWNGAPNVTTERFLGGTPQREFGPRSLGARQNVPRTR